MEASPLLSVRHFFFEGISVYIDERPRNLHRHVTLIIAAYEVDFVSLEENGARHEDLAAFCPLAVLLGET